MRREEKEMLIGFARAAELTRRVLISPPSHTTAKEYLEDVARLLAHSDDYLSRGLVLGCLSALGRE